MRGRPIIDSVFIANECISYHIEASLPGFFCKLDLEKAYDHWNFLLYFLERCGFSEKWKRWIFFGVSFVWFSILVNGSLCGFFSSLEGFTKGILCLLCWADIRLFFGLPR